MNDNTFDSIDNENEEFYDEYSNYRIIKTQRQINREWTFINALRDGIGIYFKGSKTATYKDIVDIGSTIAPAILGDERLLFNDKKLNILYEKYREKSDALSQKEQQEISIIESVIRDIKELKELIIAGNKTDLFVLNKELKALEKFLSELETSSHTENNLIIRDVYKAERGLPFEDGKDYRDFKDNENRAFRIRILHPDHLEHITGADLIYECYSEEYEKVRVAAVQYKIRRTKSVYIDERAGEQLSRLENAFCSKEICQFATSTNKYRLPYCTAFLRPTNEIQINDPQTVSKGYYVPICIVKEQRERNPVEKRHIIESKRLRDHAVTHKVFEELFNADILGSKWITYDELKSIYQSTNLLKPHQSITVHIQEFSLRKPNKNPRNTRRAKTIKAEQKTSLHNYNETTEQDSEIPNF